MEKKLIIPLLLIIFSMSSCNNWNPLSGRFIIRSITHENTKCTYNVYIPLNEGYIGVFRKDINIEDSCNKWKIGDTLWLTSTKPQ